MKLHKMIREGGCVKCERKYLCCWIKYNVIVNTISSSVLGQLALKWLIYLCVYILFAIFWLYYSFFLEGIKVAGMQISHWLVTWTPLQEGCFTSTSGVRLVLCNTVSICYRGASFLLHTPYTCELDWLCQYAWLKLGM